MSEGEERTANSGLTQFPSLGACIRRITVATHPGCFSARHGIGLGRRFNALAEDLRKTRLADASRTYFDVYLQTIQCIFSNRSVLPHLELLDWEDKIALPQSFYNSLACSSLQHLKLYRVRVEEEFTIRLPSALATEGWRLRSLHLDIFPSVDKLGEISISPLCNSILRLCASTLESLTWESSYKGDLQSFATDHLDLPRFFNLRNLKLL